MKSTTIAITTITAISTIPTAIPKLPTTIIGVMTTPEIVVHYHLKTITRITIRLEILMATTPEIDGIKINLIRAIIQIAPIGIHRQIDLAQGIIRMKAILVTIDIPIVKITTITPIRVAMTIPLVPQPITPPWIDFAKMMVTM